MLYICQSCRHTRASFRSSLRFFRAVPSRQAHGVATTKNSLNLALLNRAQRLSNQFEHLSRESVADTDFNSETAARQKKIAELQHVHDKFKEWSGAKTVTDTA